MGAKCYTQMGFPIRAQQIVLKAREVCDGDKMMLEEIALLWKQIGTLKKKQKEKQAKQFEGYFEKLGDQGGYMTKKAAKAKKFGEMNQEQKVKLLERLDDEDGEDDDQFEGFAESPEARPSLKFSAMQALKGMAEVVPTGKEFNFEKVMSARQGEAEQRAAAWQKAFTERKSRMEPD